MAELVKHLKGTQGAYEALSGGGGYSADTLYFTTEFSGDNELNTGRIYLGGTLMAKPSVWEELTEPSPYQMVDLGLPSGLKWADRNVGAESPEAYGDYFAWGETAPRGGDWPGEAPYDWAHAPFNNGQEYFDDEYFNANSGTWLDVYSEEGDIRLKPKYDAAHVIMGGSWRMPTQYEMQELIGGTYQHVEELNGVKGMRFTSYDNGNSIFMPLAGRHYGSAVNYERNISCAWSSSLDAGDSSHSYRLYFNKDQEAYDDSGDRYIGFVVRGVCQ